MPECDPLVEVQQAGELRGFHRVDCDAEPLRCAAHERRLAYWLECGD
jgi:hypothetical protein